MESGRNYETPVEGDHSYATPIVLRQTGGAIAVVGGEHVSLHDPARQEFVDCGDFNPEQRRNWPTVASPVVLGDLAIVPYGRADRGQPRLHGIKIGDHPGGSERRIWKRDDTGTFVPTPVAHKGLVYVVRDRGEVDCIEPATGRTVWSDAFPKSSANFYASPVIADGKLYARARTAWCSSLVWMGNSRCSPKMQWAKKSWPRRCLLPTDC